MRNDRHVSDIRRTVHQETDLLDGKVDHGGGWFFLRSAFEAGMRLK